MIKRFFKDSFIYTFSLIITGGVSFFMLPFFTSFFDVEAYGVYDYLVVLGSFVGLTVALEISQGVARFVPEALDDTERKRRYSSASLWFTLCCFGIFLSFVYVFAEPLASLLFDAPNLSRLLRVAATSYATYAVVYLIINQLKWELKPGQSSLVSITYSVVAIMSAVYYVSVRSWGVEGAFWGNITGGVAAATLGFYFTRTSYGFTFKWDALREMLSFSFPLVFSSAAVFLSNYIDRIAIKELMSLSALGIYGVAFRLSFFVLLASYGFQSALTPLVYRYYNQEDTPQRLAILFRYFIILSLGIHAGLSLFAPEIVGLMTASGYAEAATIIPVLVLSVLFTRMYIFFPGLGIRKKTFYIAVINIGSAALNLLLNLLFIPVLGLMGAALATALSALLCLMAYIYFSQKYYPIPFKTKAVLVSTVSILAAVFTAVYLFNDMLCIPYKILLLLLIPVLMALTGLITRSDLIVFMTQIRSLLNFSK